jgi:GT2 family glycosyltransferase
MSVSVTVGVVTWNSASVIEACLASVRGQGHAPLTLRVADNASADGTRALLERLTSAQERRYFPQNLGFSAAHNALIAASTTDLYLALNPDVVMTPEFVARLADALARDPEAGSATGKLLRFAVPAPPGSPIAAATPASSESAAAAGSASSRAASVDILDSTGILMLPSQRHLDRGADREDAGQYARAEPVFGASGAAAMYRRAMLEDTRVAGEYFDEDFFAYREDADLAWRAQLLGWRCLYVPDAIARHGRRVTPERRSALAAAINACSVRNRFLLRLKNQTAGHAVRFLLPTLARDLQVIGYVLLREHSSLGALGDVIRLWPRTWAKRRAIMARRRRSTREMIAWFRTGAAQHRVDRRTPAGGARPVAHA